MGNFREVLNFNQLFLRLNQFICNYTQLSYECGLSFGVTCCIYIIMSLSFFIHSSISYLFGVHIDYLCYVG